MNDEVKRSLSIVQVLAKYVKIKRAGRNYLALCPFHHEKTPSFTINEEKKFFHCFGCGRSGDIFTFIMEILSCSYPEALAYLAEMAGIRLEKRVIKENPLESACNFFVSNLSKEVVRYLRSRGLSNDTIKKFRLGYCPISLKNSEYRLFSGRITFPIFNEHNSIIGFGGRSLTDQNPKYLNSAESEIFIKKQVLYGIEQLNSWSPQREKRGAQVLLVEGYMDVLVLAQHGIDAVAILGTSVNEDHLLKLWEKGKEIIIAFDNDNAGQAAAAKAKDLALAIGSFVSNIKFITYHDHKLKDAAEIIHHQGAEYFKDLITHSLPLSEFVWENLKNQRNAGSPEERASLKVECDQLLNNIHPTVRSFYRNFFYNKIYKPDKLAAKKVAIPPYKSDIEERLIRSIIDFPQLIHDLDIAEELLMLQPSSGLAELHQKLLHNYDLGHDLGAPSSCVSLDRNYQDAKKLWYKFTKNKELIHLQAEYEAACLVREFERAQMLANKIKAVKEEIVTT